MWPAMCITQIFCVSFRIKRMHVHDRRIGFVLVVRCCQWRATTKMEGWGTDHCWRKYRYVYITYGSLSSLCTRAMIFGKSDSPTYGRYTISSAIEAIAITISINYCKVIVFNVCSVLSPSTLSLDVGFGSDRQIYATTPTCDGRGKRKRRKERERRES